ncbi:MAG TPA: hypothetical protein VF933_12960 [Streptosporangiaceae bacterium]
MATRDVFSAQELARLRGFGEITRAELVRYFTLTSAEIQQLRLSQRGVTAGETREHGLDLDGPTIGQVAALY